MLKSTLHCEKFMKTKKLLVFKHDTLTPPLISRDCESWEPLFLYRRGSNSEGFVNELEVPSGTTERADSTGPKTHPGIIGVNCWWLRL